MSVESADVVLSAELHKLAREAKALFDGHGTKIVADTFASVTKQLADDPSQPVGFLFPRNTEWLLMLKEMFRVADIQFRIDVHLHTCPNLKDEDARCNCREYGKATCEITYRGYT